jgi:hypothetical protein
MEFKELLTGNHPADLPDNPSAEEIRCLVIHTLQMRSQNGYLKTWLARDP